MITMLIQKLLDYLGIGISPKTVMLIIAVLSVLGALWVFKDKIAAYEQLVCTSDNLAGENAALKLQLAEAQQYSLFLAAAKKKNEDFITRQRKAIRDAKENDGPVADVLRGTYDRLRRDDEENGRINP